MKAVIKRNEDAWKQALGARDEAAKERCMEVYSDEKRKDRGVYIYHSKKDVNESCVGKRKMFWKDVSKVNKVKVESCSRV